jgi:CheY-like chemotaxis protein
MDHRMPGMTGTETVEAIRKMGVTIPIIALTASVYPNAKEKMLAAGMNDYLTKPIIKTELIRILKKWIPADKLMEVQPTEADGGEFADDSHREFWNKIDKIDSLDLMTGLERVDSQRDVYEKTLKLMMREIEKSDKNLPAFLSAEDMENFGIEVHGIKGTLANIGAMDLSAKAFELETAADKQDTVFCVSNLPEFLKRLNILYTDLKDAFTVLSFDDDSVEIPADLPTIFEKLTGAFEEIDLVVIDQEIESIDALNLSGKLKDTVEQIKDAVMMMDYAGAAGLISKLLQYHAES